jgi:hypothetical protein
LPLVTGLRAHAKDRTRRCAASGLTMRPLTIHRGQQSGPRRTTLGAKISSDVADSGYLPSPILPCKSARSARRSSQSLTNSRRGPCQSSRELNLASISSIRREMALRPCWSPFVVSMRVLSATGEVATPYSWVRKGSPRYLTMC